MHLVGLFDRPMSADCQEALRRRPAIEGLTDAIAEVDEGHWQRAVARLREIRLLAPADTSAPDALDAHPLVREWFGDRLRQTNKTAWTTAHGQLYEHLRDATKEGKEPTLEDLGPLYQAIAHGCRAGWYQQALNQVFIDRICRWKPEGGLEFYANLKLGALSSELAALSWFFDKPYEVPISKLNDEDQSWVLSVAAFNLRAQGRFRETLTVMRATSRISENAKDIDTAAYRATNLSEAELLGGDVAAALSTAKKAVTFADRSDNQFLKMMTRTTLATVLHMAGRSKEADRLFAEAERRQRKQQPQYPLLYSLRGYEYCNLLLAKNSWVLARNSGNKVGTYEAMSRSPSLLDRGLRRLWLGRAYLGLALASIDHQKPREAHRDASAACVNLDEAIEGLRKAGTAHHLPRGLLARAAFRRSVGDWADVARDLDEVEEIAEPGPMKLFLCDMALERARLAFAKIEAFAPLNELIENGPPKPEQPDEAERDNLMEQANKELAIATEYIKTCGYHRRDKELAELKAVLRGDDKKFADLPPRV